MHQQLSFLLRSFNVLFISVLVYLSQAVAACEKENGIQPYCGISSPEDVVPIPGTPLLIASQLLEDNATFVLFDTKSQQYQQLTPLANASYPPAKQRGDTACKPPSPDSAFHGIDLIRNADGSLSLLAVYHGELDSVQWFDVMLVDTTIDLQWQGCVTIPEHTVLNDVAALPQGRFAATASARVVKTMNKPWQVIQWQSNRGLSTVMDFSTGYGNGINFSAEGKFLYINDMTNGKVIKANSETGDILAEVAVAHPDNNSWTDDGHLLVTSLVFDNVDQVIGCIKNRDSHCNLPFIVTQLDPVTMTVKELYRYDGKTIFGGATVAVRLGEQLYLGSFAGNRIASVTLN